jgi:hypothetical protein
MAAEAAAILAQTGSELSVQDFADGLDRFDGYGRRGKHVLCAC